MIASEGEFVTWGADDGHFLPNSLTEAVDFLEKNRTSNKDIVTCKYTEGESFSPDMLKDLYYKINHAQGLRSKHIPDDYWILNVGILDTEYAKELGGWDTQFAVTTISHMDFAVRTQRAGSKYFMLEKPIFTCSHLPGPVGDHAPVHYSHVEHDEPLFREIYNNPNSTERIKIDLNNWEQQEERWSRRFNDCDLSVCLAAIRKDNWEKLYNSIEASIGEEYSFEIIFCGPHAEPPDSLSEKKNITCIQDYGPPTRAQQIAIKHAKGRYMTWTADDGWFLENKLSECIKFLDSTSIDKKVVVTQYIEGGSDGLGNYSMNYHEPVRSPYYSDDFVVFNSVIMETEYFKQLGGFDCRFEACPMAYVDFGARAQKDYANVFMTGVIYECTQFVGDTGDHAPIHYAQLEHDQPLYKKIWRDPDCTKRLKIDFDNWQTAPEVWDRRFGNVVAE